MTPRSFSKRHTSLDRVLGRLDALDSINLANLVQRLARERALFEDIFNALKEGVLVIRSSGEIEYANVAAHEMIGLGEGSLVGEVLWRLMPGLRPVLGVDIEDEESLGALPVMTREFEMTYPEPRAVRLYLVPVQGAPRRFAVILSDITRDKEVTERMLEDERSSSIFLLAGSVAHEIGNPLNSITIHLQLLERRLRKLSASKDNEAMAASVSACQEEVRRLDGIITHFLEAIRPKPPSLVETNLMEVLDQVLGFQQTELANRGLTLEAETAEQLPAVMADRDQLKQVYFNLTKNAMEAMQTGGHLCIRAAHDDDNVYVMFGDSGSGIRQEDLMRLFQPYHTTKSGGSGLGLMIVQRIMREHGGTVSVESREGLGTVVTLQFPRKDRRVRMLGGG